LTRHQAAHDEEELEDVMTKKNETRLKREIAEALGGKSLYQDLKAAGVPTDHHESDLYALDTPIARALVEKHGWRGVSAFTSQIGGKQWLDMPFAYDPFWEKAAKSHATKKASKEITGFEFLIKDHGKSYWTALQGSGGQLGAGALHAIRNLDPKNQRVQALCAKLLREAQKELQHEGTIRTYRDDEDPGQRIRPVAASAIQKARPVVG
jgi:hypothetical protein